MFPDGLETLSFGVCFSKSLQPVTLPSSLQRLDLGETFNQSLEGKARVLGFTADGGRVLGGSGHHLFLSRGVQWIYGMYDTGHHFISMGIQSMTWSMVFMCILF